MPNHKVLAVLLWTPALCAWMFLVWVFEDIRLFTLILPPVLLINFAKNRGARNAAISVFAVLWLFIFHFESTRYFYFKEPVARKIDEALPKFKFLFPPIGWIMFYNIGESSGYVEVYGKRQGDIQLMDPHDIFRTRTFGYDNIHRGILGTASYRENANRFCRFLYHRFDDFETFLVTAVHYPNRSREPYTRIQNVLYQCPERSVYEQ